MTPLQRAREEWEANTTPHPKKHPLSKFRPAFHTHEFREFAEAIAWVEWDGKFIEIKKIEKIPCAGRGAAIPIVNFLKVLADKYHVRLWGQAKSYTPDPPWCDDERILSQEELEAWYERRGFQLVRQRKPAPTWIGACAGRWLADNLAQIFRHFDEWKLNESHISYIESF